MFWRCLGDVSVLFRYSWCCFGCFREVSVVWSSLGDALLMSRGCRGDVSVMFQWCLSDVSVMSW